MGIYRVRRYDPNNIVLEQYVKAKNKKTKEWVWIWGKQRYFGKTVHLVAYILNQEWKLSDTQGSLEDELRQLIRDFENLSKRFSYQLETLTPIDEVDGKTDIILVLGD